MEPTPPALPAPSGPPAAPWPPRKSAMLFFLTVLLLFLPGLVAQALSRPGGLAWTELFVFLLPPIIAATGSNLRPAALLGLDRARARHVLLGALMGVAGFLLGSGLMLAWVRLLPRSLLKVFDVAKVFDAPLAEQIAIAAVATLLAPVCEETAFRGYLQRTLALRRPPAVAIGVSALLFALLHVDPVRFPALVVLGVLFGWLAWRAGSTWPAIAAHAVNNGLASGLVLAEGVAEPQADPPLAAIIPWILLGAVGLAFLVPAYRAATDPPAPADAAVLADPSDPSTRFSLERVPKRLWAVAAAGVALLLALVAARIRHPV